MVWASLWDASLDKCFGQALLGGGLAADPGLAGEIASLGWRGHRGNPLEEVAGEKKVWVSQKTDRWMSNVSMLYTHAAEVSSLIRPVGNDTVTV